VALGDANGEFDGVSGVVAPAGVSCGRVCPCSCCSFFCCLSRAFSCFFSSFGATRWSVLCAEGLEIVARKEGLTETVAEASGAEAGTDGVGVAIFSGVPNGVGLLLAAIGFGFSGPTCVGLAVTVGAGEIVSEGTTGDVSLVPGRADSVGAGVADSSGRGLRNFVIGVCVGAAGARWLCVALGVGDDAAAPSFAAVGEARVGDGDNGVEVVGSALA